VTDLVAIVRSYGSDASDIRDAAHEACHALKWGVRGKWDRESIHRRKPRVPGFGVADEMEARAVERVVCERLGYDPGPIEQWAMTCWMETLKSEGISLPTGTWVEDRIRERLARPATLKLAERILELKPRPARKGGK
jgi:hypothetical protein